MLMIRLARRGKKNKPFYRVVVSEKARDMFGKAQEIVGYVNTLKNPQEISLEKERILYWLSVGAQASPTVHNILVNEKVIDAKKIVKNKPRAKKEKGK